MSFPDSRFKSQRKKSLLAERARLRDRIRSIERRRLARDLHDGVVQSVIATELQLEFLRRRSLLSDQPAVSHQAILDAQNALRAEVVKLRRHIDQLRSNAVPGPFLECLRQIVDAFRRETGIHATLNCNIERALAPGRFTSEVLHIVEEALSNIRRHSGATTASVSLVSHGNNLEILIEDDGCGLDFSGRLSLSQLNAMKKGPKVIRERVHSVNGELVVESTPNRGSLLEIRLAANL